MKSVVLFVLLTSLLGLSSQLTAQSSDEISKTVQENILNGLKEARPDLDFGNPVPSPIDGYYEVSISAGQTVYVSEDGKHFFSGELYFAEPGRFINATEMARTKMRLTTLASIDESEMIIFKPEGESKAVMTVFTDVTCGYCRKLHGQMAEMNALGIEVRYMAYPRSGISRDGVYTREYQETSKAWCSDDPKGIMTSLKNGQQVGQDYCDSDIVNRHYLMGAQFGVTGTPAIIMPDGTLLPGYRSPQDYAQLLGIQ